MKFLKLALMVWLRAMTSVKGVILIGPCMSIEARGKYGDAIIFSKIKGVMYAKKYFVPANPQSAEQTNVRLAMALLVTSWQNQHVTVQGYYNTFAQGTKRSGFATFVSRGMFEYVSQITVAVTPVSVAVDAVAPPAEVWTWT